jgi:hypothetical protein
MREWNNGGLLTTESLPQCLKLNTVAWVRERTIPTERPLLVGEVSANFFADRRCHVVSVTDYYGRILGFLDRSRYFFFQVAPQFYSRGWVDPIPDPLLLRKSGSAETRTRTSGSVARNSDLDHRGGLLSSTYKNSVRTSQQAKYICVM